MSPSAVDPEVQSDLLAEGAQVKGTITASLAVSHDSTESAVLYSRLDDQPLKATSSKGCWITTENGHEIFDASCGAAVACLGHNNERVNAAILRQLNDIAYIYAPFLTSEPAEKLARELSESTGHLLPKAFIVSSGTESIEAAVKMARQYFLEVKQPRRTNFIARRQSYHGNTLGSLSLGCHPVRKAPYFPLLSTNVSHVSPCYAYRDQKIGESDKAYVARLAQELEDEFQTVGPETVCAFVAETHAGSTLGSVPPVPGYFKAMREVCDRHGALLILDEVMSGMGRCGTIHAWQQEDVVPDLQTIAKGLGAGFIPIGALLIGKKIVEALGKGSGAFVHSQTYQGHPVACAAAYEVQQIIKEDNLMKNVGDRGAQLEKMLQARLGNHKHVGDIRGRGLFWGIEFVLDKSTKEPFPVERKISSTIQRTGLLEFGISVIPSSGCADGKNGDIVQIAPAYSITEAEVELLVDRITKVVERVLG